MKELLTFLRQYCKEQSPWHFRLTEMNWRRMQSSLKGQDRHFLGLHCDGKNIYAFFDNDGNPLSIILSLEKNQYPSLSSVLKSAAFYERAIYDLFGAEALWAEDEKPLIDRNYWASQRPLSSLSFPNHYSRKEQQASHTGMTLGGGGHHFFKMVNLSSGAIGVEGIQINGRIISAQLLHGYVHRGMLARCRHGRIRDVWTLCGRFEAGQSVAHQLAFSNAIEKICDVKIDDNMYVLRRVFLEMETILTHLLRLLHIAELLGLQKLVTNCMILRENLLSYVQYIVPSRLLMDVCRPGGVSVENISRVEALFLDMCAMAWGYKNHFIKRWLHDPSLKERLSDIGKISNEMVLQSGIDGPLYRAASLKERQYFQSYMTLYDRVKIMVEEIFECLKSIELASSQTSSLSEVSMGERYQTQDGDMLSWVEGEWGRVAYWVKLKDGRVQDIFCGNRSMTISQLCQESLKGTSLKDLELSLASFGVNAYGFDG